MKRRVKDICRRVFSWYFTRKALPYWCVLIFDSFVVVASMFVAHFIGCTMEFTPEHVVKVLLSLCAYLICFVIGFRIFRTYQGVVRYSSFIDLFRIAGAVLVGSVLVEFLRVFAHSDNFLESISGHDLLLGDFMAIFFMWMSRIVIKVGFDTRYHLDDAPHIMIFGTKEGGVSIAKSIRNQHPSPYEIYGFVTYLNDMVGHTLLDKPVFEDKDKALAKYITDNKVKLLFVSPLAQEAFVNDCQDFIEWLIRHGVKIMMMPPEQEWDGKSALTHSLLKDVSVEDLLPRKKIEVNLDSIGAMLKDKRILITGAAGSIGSEMVRQVAKFGPSELVLVDQAETPMHDMRLFMNKYFPQMNASSIVSSISNPTQMEMIFRTHRPEYVFHAAAYKHVPMMEDNPAMAVQNNIYGTRVVADLAVKYGTLKFVMISTDKAVNPTNVMGCSKRICEIYCQSLNKEVELGNRTTVDGDKAVTQFVTTRFGNVLGSNGSVIPIFKRQIQKGGPVTVTHPDIIRFFMLIPEACRLVLEAGTMGHGGEIFVFDMGEPVKISALAQRMIDLMGAKDCKIVYTGLRDGEKLYEEVLNEAEHTKPTCHPKIQIAAVREYPYDKALKDEQELYDLSFSYDDMAIVRKMKSIVPEYKSRHSKYEAIDKENEAKGE